MNKTLLFLIILILYNIVFSQMNDETKANQEELKSCEKESEIKLKENTFLLKTNLSENELEKLISQDFSSFPNKNSNGRKRKNDINVKKFKSKDDLNKTILLLEINNISEYSNKTINKELSSYELIDVKVNDETKIFLSFDKFFKSQYKEMFDYSYTIIIAFLVFIGMLIYYAFLLPNEAPVISRSSRNMGTRDNNENNINNENDIGDNYILKE